MKLDVVAEIGQELFILKTNIFPESNTNKQTNTRAKKTAPASQHLVASEALAHSSQHYPRHVGFRLHEGLRVKCVYGQEADVSRTAPEAEEQGYQECRLYEIIK